MSSPSDSLGVGFRRQVEPVHGALDGAQAGDHRVRRRGGLLAADRARRGRHDRAPEGIPPSFDRPGHRPAWWADHQDHGRRPARRVLQSCRGRALRRRTPARHGWLRGIPPGGAPHPVPDRHQSRRRGRRGQRCPGRRREYRRTPASVGGCWRHLRLPLGS